MKSISYYLLMGRGPGRNKHGSGGTMTRSEKAARRKVKKSVETQILVGNEGGNSYFKEFLPTSKRDYYQDLHNKHFDPSTAVGSVFTKASDIEDLLEIADREEGGIRRDDRDKFIAEGADPDGFLPQCRYVKVETAGENGILPVSECDKDEKVHVVRTKVGAPCSLVIERSSRPKTNSATIIFGPDPESGNEIVWTAHPGAPIRPSSGDSWDEGSTITVQDVIDTSGKGAWLQVEVA